MHSLDGVFRVGCVVCLQSVALAAFHSGDREKRAWLSCAVPDKSFQVTGHVVQPDGVMVNSGACEQTATKRPEDRFRSKLNQTSKCVITIGSVEGIRCLFLPKM